jgi:hypothetical protein
MDAGAALSLEERTMKAQEARMRGGEEAKRRRGEDRQVASGARSRITHGVSRFTFHATRNTQLLPRNLLLLLFVLVVTIGVGGCGAGPRQPLLLGEAVWQSGERSLYQVTNREGRVVGAAHITIEMGGEHIDEGWTFRQEIGDIGVSEISTVEAQRRGYIPVHSYMVRISDGGRRQVVEAEYDRAEVNIALTSLQGSTVYERVNVPSDVRDDRTILSLVRTLPLAQGYVTAMNSFLPITGLMERQAIRVVRGEQITVPAGSFDTWLVELKTPARTTRAWIAKESPHILVKFVEGRSQATFDLTDYEPGGLE